VSAFAFGAYLSAVTLGVVWLLYPLVMAALASVARRRVRPAQPHAERVAGSVSIVVATRDDAAAVQARVEDLLNARNVPAQL